MKKIVTYAVAGMMLAGTVLGTAACRPPVDREAPAFETASALLSIDGGTDRSDSRNQLSDELFGLFLEDINYAGYAITSNVIMNGSFEYSEGMRGWATFGGAQASVLSEGGVCETNAHYAQLTVSNGSGISNSGYDACKIYVERNVDYAFSAFIKATDYTGDMTVQLTDGMTVFAEQTVAISKGDAWKKYATTLTATATADERVLCRVSFSGSGTVCVDGIELHTQDSTGGIKNYMYNAIKDLAPSFIRFPGGCVIEGKGDDTAYDWKNSIGVNKAGEATVLTYDLVENGESKSVTTTGEPSTRTANRNIWQTGNNYYEMDYAIGFYEYFLLCDNLNASAIPIVNCGISCMIQRSASGATGIKLPGRNGNGIQDFIQDALDLVAFAKGDPDSNDTNEAYWATVRKSMGHEEPFEMTYLGIGNEQWGGVYFSYYQQFIEAFKQAKAENPALYGDVQLIVGNGPNMWDVENGTARKAAESYQASGKITNISEYGMQDHHYYMNYSDFFSYVGLYDKFSRHESTRFDIFVGEYSANQQVNQKKVTYSTANNSWIGALSEAAYMTGLERNADIVKLAAYAPMFGSINASQNQWAVDMMYFTNSQVLRSNNYYVQQIFAQNAGDFLLESQTEFYDESVETGSIYGTGLLGKIEQKISSVYQVVTVDKKTGDVIIKIVNPTEHVVDLNIEVLDSRLAGIAYVTRLQCDLPEAVNTLTNEYVSPETFTLGVQKKFGYTVEKYSVNVIRVAV